MACPYDRNASAATGRPRRQGERAYRAGAQTVAGVCPGRRCRYCGNQLAARTADIREGERDCAGPGANRCANPLGAELYGAVVPAPVCTECCDPYSGCRRARADQRNPFWPSFAHPRWLPCDVLYGRR